MVCICTLKSTPPFPRKTAPPPPNALLLLQNPGSLSCSAFGQPPGDAANRSPFLLLLLLHPMERAPGTRQKASSRLRQPLLLLLGAPHCLPLPIPDRRGGGSEAVCVCLQGGSRPINQGGKCEHAVAFPSPSVAPIVVGPVHRPATYGGHCDPARWQPTSWEATAWAPPSHPTWLLCA